MLSLWSDTLRDADQLGLRFTRIKENLRRRVSRSNETFEVRVNLVNRPGPFVTPSPSTSEGRKSTISVCVKYSTSKLKLVPHVSIKEQASLWNKL